MSKKLSTIPTWKIQEILNSHHTTGIDGADYEDHKEELEHILWARQDAEAQKLLAIQMRNYNEKHIHDLKNKGKK